MTGQLDGTGIAAQLTVPLRSGQTCNVPLTNPSADHLLAEFEQLLAERKGFAAATVNLDHVVKLRQSIAFRDAYARHSHVVADGNPIVWLSKLAGQSVNLVPGSELVAPVAELAARLGVPLGFFGASEMCLSKAAAALEDRYPGLQVTDLIAPPQGFDPAGPDADRYIDRMANVPARFWLLALGAPKQEIFAARAWERLPDHGFLSIGAGLDFIAGHQHRAPEWVQELALEWAWRMVGSPRRLGPRYTRCIAALPGLAAAALKQRKSARHIAKGQIASRH